MYSVKVVQNGCTSAASNEINIVNTSTKPPKFEMSIHIFPNAVHKILFIHSKGSPNQFRLTITDIQGRVIYPEKTFTSELEIDVSSWLNGIYLVSITNKHGERIQQLVIKR